MRPDRSVDWMHILSLFVHAYDVSIERRAQTDQSSVGGAVSVGSARGRRGSSD
jgi:hypothetical protein